MDKKPLRILAVVNLPWDERLGAPRVWMELAEQWRASGHVVEKFSLSDAFPGRPGSGVSFGFRQLLFVRKAAAFIRQHGHRFDVIDALIGTVPFAREKLGFRGLLVARSVGLYSLYERFERSVPQRWKRPAQGTFAGGLLYRFIHSQLRSASEAGVRCADLVNVPNESEAQSLRDELHVRAPVVVEPYGLAEERRIALSRAARSAEERLAQKRVCFVGMWSARKSAYDWGRIIAGVRVQVPEARFRFLGTMIDDAVVRRDLREHGGDHSEVELIAHYQPDELPRLLADCTVAAFPSFVEGFGLAVLEQLAAHLPTVAYDVAGPRDILQRGLGEFLVPPGDVPKLVAQIAAWLTADSERYRGAARRAEQVASSFSWRPIAQNTIDTYRRFLRDRKRPVVFVQPFSLGSAGGGARILRALLNDAPFSWRSICSAPARQKPWRDELRVPSRPFWGKIEHSRFGSIPVATMRFFARGFRRRLKRRVVALNAGAIHAVAHGGLDFAEAQIVARELSLPFLLSVHDDLAYTFPHHTRKREAALRRAWRDATARFVISQALGEEYARRYGAREYVVVTDGLAHLSQPRRVPSSDELRVYFMGMFHLGYEDNLRALLDAIALLENEGSARKITVTLRCEYVRPHVLAGHKHVQVLPFASEEQVRRDMETVDLLYLPMPFGPEHERFVRYSLSTKMVTYAGSGAPILYHGPADSAAFQLLNEARAAIPLHSLAAPEIARTLRTLEPVSCREYGNRALELARRDFMLGDQVERFCGTIASRVAEQS